MNFTNSPYEKMMKEIPRPGRGGADRRMPLLKRVRQQKRPLPQEVSPLGPSWPEVLMCRELTRDERKGIRKLVTEMCANYDREYGCLPLDCECYMLGKCWTGAYCRYFREAVLPLDPVLSASICEDGPARTPACALSAGGPFSRRGGKPTAPKPARPRETAEGAGSA